MIPCWKQIDMRKSIAWFEVHALGEMFFHRVQAGGCLRRALFPLSLASTWECEKGPEVRLLKLGLAENP